MPSVCPVCNGLSALHADCPRCASECRDEGRLNDCFGPYSPYRPIDDIGLTNGVMDVGIHTCTHVVRCPDCKTVCYAFVEEWMT